MQAYEGYFENGCFYTAGRTIIIPERRRVFVTVLEEPPAQIKVEDKNLFWAEFDRMVDESKAEILNDENFSRLNLGRELLKLSD